MWDFGCIPKSNFGYKIGGHAFLGSYMYEKLITSLEDFGF